MSDAEVATLRQMVLPVLMSSELVISDSSSAALVPGGTQYLMSLAQVALSACVEIPELWDGSQQTGQLLERLLRCPQYEVRELAVEGVLRRLEEEKKRMPQWLDETTLSNLTSLALHETHPQCLAKVRPHTHLHKDVTGGAFGCLRTCVWLFYRCV